MEIEERIKELVIHLILAAFAGVFGTVALIFWRFFDV
jgi:hypothetical protein